MTHLLLLTLLATTRMYSANVVGCYDGDTCTIDVYWGINVGLGMTLGAIKTGEKVRLCDIEAPEMRSRAGVVVTAEQKVVAKISRDALLRQINQAKKIRIEAVQKKNCDYAERNDCDQRDKYGRLLVYIIADEVNLNEWMVESGFAEEYHIQCP